MSLESPRKPSRIPVCTVLANAERYDLFHLTGRNIHALDAQMTGIEFGYVTIKIAHGRVAGFDALRSTRVMDDLVGQGVGEKQSA